MWQHQRLQLNVDLSGDTKMFLKRPMSRYQDVRACE
jgi:hypothetical protein